MKLSQAMKIIDSNKGFMVAFECPTEGGVQSDHFPDKHGGEELIKTEVEAWVLAERFADQSKGKYYSIYVIGNDFRPVDKSSEPRVLNGYRDKS